MPIFWKVLTAALLIAYPFIVYFSLRYIQPYLLGALLALVFSARLFVIYRSLGKQVFYQQLFPFGSCMVLLLIVMVSNDALGLRFTPVLINLGGFAMFAWTLYKPPSMIERFARLIEKDLPKKTIDYTRNVTMVWCGFFIFNTIASFYTAWFLSIEAWTLYNGCIAYLLVALLFGVEYLVRLRFRQKHGLVHGKH